MEEKLINYFNTEVKEKYKNIYFRELVILYHLDELVLKKNKIISSNKNDKPFKDDDFLKELADLKILLDMHSENDKFFEHLIEERKCRFAYHTLNERNKNV